MNDYKRLVINDFKRLYEYRIVHMILVISFLFAVTIGFFEQINPSNLIYVIVFIMPVVVFAFSLHSDFLTGQLVSCEDESCSPMKIFIAKLSTSLTLQMIPFVLISIVLLAVRQLDFSLGLFFLGYLLSVGVHIVIGLALALISRSEKILSLSYVVYIIIFCMGPIFLSNGLIPSKFEYFLIFSPAYLSGVLLDNILAGVAYSPTWLIWLSVLIQMAYAIVLALFVIRPFFRDYLALLRKRRISREK
ncbi:MAG: hypothetical protein JXB20_00010 [Bacilli bacterium]|nr:hypothetical protein [Bacilli bacterium]